MPSLEWQREFPEASRGAQGRSSRNWQLLTRLKLFLEPLGPRSAPGRREAEEGEEGSQERSHAVHTFHLPRHQPLLFQVNTRRVIFTCFLIVGMNPDAACLDWQLTAPPPHLPGLMLPPCSCHISGLLPVILCKRQQPCLGIALRLAAMSRCHPETPFRAPAHTTPGYTSGYKCHREGSLPHRLPVLRVISIASSMSNSCVQRLQPNTVVSPCFDSALLSGNSFSVTALSKVHFIS